MCDLIKGDAMRISEGYRFTTFDRGEYVLCSMRKPFKHRINTIGIGGWWATQCFGTNLNSIMYLQDELQASLAVFCYWQYAGGFRHRNDRTVSPEMKIRPGSNTLHI